MARQTAQRSDGRSSVETFSARLHRHGNPVPSFPRGQRSCFAYGMTLKAAPTVLALHPCPGSRVGFGITPALVNVIAMPHTENQATR